MERPEPRKLTTVVVQLLWILGACDSGGLDSHRAQVPARPPAKLALTVPPTAVIAGAAIRPAVAVAVQDKNGGTVTAAQARVKVSLGKNPAGATLSGTVKAYAVNGVAVFADLSLDRSGTGYTLTANAEGLREATSEPFNVTFAPAALAFGVQPSTTAMGHPIAPAVTVAVHDREGNTVESASTSVTVGIGINSWGGTLSGPLTAAAVNGVAIFPGLSIDTAGRGYTLAASANGLGEVGSAAFNVDLPDGGVPFAAEVFRLYEAPAMHASLAAAPFVWAVFGDDRFWIDPCLQISIDGQPPPIGTVFPAGSHTVAATFTDCLLDLLANTFLSGTASATYTSADMNDLTAFVSVTGMRGGSFWGGLSDLVYVTVDGSGTWRRVRAGISRPPIVTTYTPDIGSTLVNGSTTNVATFGGGSYRVTEWQPPLELSYSVDETFDNLAIAVKGVSYVLNGSLQSLGGNYGGEYGVRWTGEVRITSDGTLVARIFGDVNGAVRTEVFRSVMSL
jgi:hypothetical protein